jgi:thiamine pyrophosphokinase
LSDSLSAAWPTVVVVAGGDPPSPHAAAGLPDDRYVIAADSGLDFAQGLGLRVDLVVGDLDSVSELALASARHAGTPVERHPVAKDQTDLELALDHAVALKPARVVVIGGAGGRFDHVVAGVLQLAHERYGKVAMEARYGQARVTVVRGGQGDHVLHGRQRELVSLLPVHGPARGVTTVGLRYPLDGEDLGPGTSRGVSNEFEHQVAAVALRAGTLLAIQPDGLAP